MSSEEWKRLRLTSVMLRYRDEGQEPRPVVIELDVPFRFRADRTGRGASATRQKGSIFGGDYIYVYVHDEESIAGARGAILVGGVEMHPQRRLRLGFSDIRDECVEVVYVIQPEPCGEQRFDWGLVFREGAEWVHLRIGAVGDFTRTESYWSRVVKSLRVIPVKSNARVAAAEISQPEAVYVGLSAGEKRQLVEALSFLPEKLRYLRQPVLDVAGQDQDILGTGGADTASLAEAIENQAALQPAGFASAHAEELAEWLRKSASTEAVWARPILFVVSFLNGYEMFGEGQR